MYEAKKILKKVQKERYEVGELQIVGADKISKDGFVMISKYIMRHKHLTPASKLVWGVIVNHAWVDKDISFPGREKIAKECALSLSSVTRSLKQLQGDNLVGEAFIEVIHRGHGLTNLYKIYFKMNEEAIEYSNRRRKNEKAQNDTSRNLQVKKTKVIHNFVEIESK